MKVSYDKMASDAVSNLTVGRRTIKDNQGHSVYDFTEGPTGVSQRRLSCACNLTLHFVWDLAGRRKSFAVTPHFVPIQLVRLPMKSSVQRYALFLPALARIHEPK